MVYIYENVNDMTDFGVMVESEEKEKNMESLLKTLMKKYPDYYNLRGLTLQKLPESERESALHILKSEFLK